MPVAFDPTSAADAAPARLALRGITKRYGAVVANGGIDLTVAPGEIHALLGENGSGKSTLMKIVYASVAPDSGTVRIDGVETFCQTPREARALGIAMVFQHFSLFDTLTVAENVWLGLDRSQALAEVSRRIEEKAAAYGLDIDPRRPVHTLSVGEMQRVEIIRALLTEPRLLILDEPTSVLTPHAVEKLFVVLRKIVAEGCSILYISHKLHEIRALCTACTVLRAGRVSGRCDPSQESDASLSRLMIGAEPPALRRRAASTTPGGRAMLTVRGLTLERETPFGVDLQDIALRVHAGEVLGIAGVSGNGQRELLLALSGEDRRAPAGSIAIGDEPVARLGPVARRALGLQVVPEERLGRGAVPSLGLAHNLLLTRGDAVGRWGWIHPAALRAQAASVMGRFQVKAAAVTAPARSLSGGNLQKFIVGREIDARPRLLIVAQPTWGVDVGAAAQIRAELLALRDDGCAVLVVSDELDELFELCDRLQVMARGRLSPSIDRAEADVERIGRWMGGRWSEGEAEAASAVFEPSSAAGVLAVKEKANAAA